jgi:RsiW-degrading membrane proteinase PrsW (M82 family)
MIVIVLMLVGIFGPCFGLASESKSVQWVFAAVGVIALCALVAMAVVVP